MMLAMLQRCLTRESQRNAKRDRENVQNKVLHRSERMLMMFKLNFHACPPASVRGLRRPK
jgi:hypothetical protein